MLKPNKCGCGTTVQTGRRAHVWKKLPENHSIYCDNCVRSVTTESLELTIKTWNTMNPIEIEKKMDAILADAERGIISNTK